MKAREYFCSNSTKPAAGSLPLISSAVNRRCRMQSNKALLDLLKEVTELRAKNQAMKGEVEEFADKFRTILSELEEAQHEGTQVLEARARRLRRVQHDMIQALETRVHEQAVLPQANQEQLEQLEEVIGDLKLNSSVEVAICYDTEEVRSPIILIKCATQYQ